MTDGLLFQKALERWALYQPPDLEVCVHPEELFDGTIVHQVEVQYDPPYRKTQYAATHSVPISTIQQLSISMVLRSTVVELKQNLSETCGHPVDLDLPTGVQL